LCHHLASMPRAGRFSGVCTKEGARSGYTPVNATEWDGTQEFLEGTFLPALSAQEVGRRHQRNCNTRAVIPRYYDILADGSHIESLVVGLGGSYLSLLDLLINKRPVQTFEAQRPRGGCQLFDLRHWSPSNSHHRECIVRHSAWRMARAQGRFFCPVVVELGSVWICGYRICDIAICWPADPVFVFVFVSLSGAARSREGNRQWQNGIKPAAFINSIGHRRNKRAQASSLPSSFRY
jgi:hypothetical protein